MMGLLGYYFRKAMTVIRSEILVLPSRVAVALFFAALLLLPVFTQDPYLLRILILTSIFAILTASWDLLSGYTGQMNFGHALFFGVGAYTAAMLNLRLGLPPWGSIPLGALAAVLAGLIVGVPSLRLKGTYLALTTLAFPIILLGIVYRRPRRHRRGAGAVRAGAAVRLAAARLLHRRHDHAGVVLAHVEDHRLEHGHHLPRHPRR